IFLFAVTQDKWAQTGWRIEQKYANKVLLGNWAEQRLQGLPSKMLFAHSGPPASHYLVTQYEESYGHRNTDALPTLQPWHADNLRGQPERVDRPISAPPTRSGPLQPTNHHFKKQQSHLQPLTVYRSAYQRHPLSAFCQARSARASRALSSHLHAPNHSNKDLHLRQRLLLQVPDHCLFPPSKHAWRQNCDS
uniref:Si:ch211-226m7.4 n=1 Tax=Salarias fasciatus TaxID=181472 RepID=A0A672J4J2_SALFA